MDISTLGSCIAIVMICYIVGMGCKASKRISDEWIPVIMAVIGGILGAVGMGIIPDFPATDYNHGGLQLVCLMDCRYRCESDYQADSAEE